MKPELSRRERDVLLLIVKGLNNKQIARELGLSLNTTKHHVSRLFDRIDVACAGDRIVECVAAGGRYHQHAVLLCQVQRAAVQPRIFPARIVNEVIAMDELEYASANPIAQRHRE